MALCPLYSAQNLAKKILTDVNHLRHEMIRVQTLSGNLPYEYLFKYQKRLMRNQNLDRAIAQHFIFSLNTLVQCRKNTSVKAPSAEDLNLINACSCSLWNYQGSPEIQRFPVTMAAGSHPFPFRTRKLRLPAPMVLGGQLPGRVGRRRNLSLKGD